VLGVKTGFAYTVVGLLRTTKQWAKLPTVPDSGPTRFEVTSVACIHFILVWKMGVYTYSVAKTALW